MGLFDIFGAGKRKKFADAVSHRLATRGWRHPVVYDPKSGALELGGEVGAISLDAVFQAWSADKHRDREAALGDAIEFIFDLPPEAPYDRVKDRLFPILRGRKVTEAMVLEPPEHLSLRWDGAFQPFTDHLVVAVAVELPHGFQPLLASTYLRWERSFGEVLEAATENLRRKPSMPVERGPPGYFASQADDGNDLARLLFPETFRTLDLRGEPVVIGAAREVVFVAGSDEPEALERMAQWVPAYLDKHHMPISFMPMVLRDGAWKPFHPPADLPAMNALPLLQHAHDCEQQRAMLLQRLKRTGRPAEISPVKLFPTDQGPVTVGFWRPSVGLLPKLDFVVVEAEGQQLARGWADVEATLNLTREPDTASPYYYAARIADPTAMASLAAAPEPDWVHGLGFSLAGGRLTVFG